MPKTQDKHIRLPYDERAAFAPLHVRKQRWACVVVHRRGGKTVALVNDLIIHGAEKPAPYAYFAPYRSQAKSVAWDYFKKYSEPLWSKPPNEAELTISLLGGSKIHLFGADNADAARGMGFGGIVCDEYGDFRPSVWGNVLRPTLSDRQGWAVFMGTPKGHNQFYDTYRESLDNPKDWFSMMLKASKSGILHPDEMTQLKEQVRRGQISQDQYDQEYECSFDAAILGAYYGREMAQVDAESRVRSVPYDPEFPVHTAWDIGFKDDTAIWWYQNIGNEVHVIDFHAESGGTVEDFVGGEMVPGSITKEILKRGYRYGTHFLPHDAKAKTLASGGKSVVEKLGRYLGMGSLAIVPDIGVESGIQAVRTTLPRCYFDTKCNKDSYGGVEALRQYQRAYDEDKKAFAKQPRHDWTSHPADAFRMLAVAERQHFAGKPAVQKTILEQFQHIERMTLDDLWAAKEAKEQELVRI